jgi:hypothetical protein
MLCCFRKRCVVQSGYQWERGRFERSFFVCHRCRNIDHDLRFEEGTMPCDKDSFARRPRNGCRHRNSLTS